MTSKKALGKVDYTDFRTDYADFFLEINLCNLFFNRCNHKIDFRGDLK